MNRKEAHCPDKGPPSSYALAPLSFRAWLAAKLQFTAVLLARRLAGLALRPAGLDLRFPVPVLRLAELALQPAGLDLRFPELDPRLAGLDLTCTLLLGREAPDKPHM